MAGSVPSPAALRYLATALRATHRSSQANCIATLAKHGHRKRNFTTSSRLCWGNRTISSPPTERQDTSFQTFNTFGAEEEQEKSKRPRPGSDAVDKSFTINEQIESLWVRVKRADGTLSDKQTLQSVIFGIDQETEVVKQLKASSGINDPAIVDVVTRQSLKDKLKLQEEHLKENQKQQRLSKPKQVELNWAISSNDLQLKLKQIRQFVEKGRRVEVLLANKKRARRATPEEAESTIESVKSLIGEIQGCKELKPMEGKIGGQALMIVGKMKG